MTTPLLSKKQRALAGAITDVINAECAQDGDLSTADISVALNYLTERAGYEMDEGIASEAGGWPEPTDPDNEGEGWKK